MRDRESSSTINRRRDQRRARNYLLDPGFQLKYTGLLVAVVLVLSAVLGLLLWSTSSAVVTQSQQAVEQGRETVRRGQQTVTLSKDLSAVVAMNIAREYGGAPELAKEFHLDAEAKDKVLVAEQMRLEEDARSLEQQASYLAVQRARTLQILVGCLAAFVVVIALTGIVFTHKIAGPVFKMTGLLRKVAQGDLVVNTGLRRGDGLVGFFASFRAMVDNLRERHVDMTTRLGRSIEDLKGEVPAEKLAALEKLHAEMAARLQDQ